MIFLNYFFCPKIGAEAESSEEDTGAMPVKSTQSQMHRVRREAGGEDNSECAEDDREGAGGEDSEGRVEHGSSRYTRNKVLYPGKLVLIFPCPFADVEIDDGKGTVIISSDPEELPELADKSLSDWIKDGAILKCDDFNQKYELKIILFHA